jgi:hypothetical protein
VCKGRLIVRLDARARCGNSARRDLCGGYRATDIPIAIRNPLLFYPFTLCPFLIFVYELYNRRRILRQAVPQACGGFSCSWEMGMKKKTEVRAADARQKIFGNEYDSEIVLNCVSSDLSDFTDYFLNQMNHNNQTNHSSRR